MDTNPNGYVYECTRYEMYTITKMNAISNGHSFERTPTQNMHNLEHKPLQMDTLLKGQYPEWTPSRMNTIPNEHNPE